MDQIEHEIWLDDFTRFLTAEETTIEFEEEKAVEEDVDDDEEKDEDDDDEDTVGSTIFCSLVIAWLVVNIACGIKYLFFGG